MMIRALLLFLVGGSLALRASEPISAPIGGASASVTQPHVVAELIPESTLVTAGKPFDVILHLHSDPGWHTYWINPGDAGLATMIKWTLPDGFSAGPIQWPTPEKHKMGPLVTYGYEGDVYLITTITPPKSGASSHLEIKAKASWLVCQEECIPGKGEFSLNLFYWNGTDPLGMPVIDNKALFEAARKRLPVANTRWEVKAAYQKKGTSIIKMLNAFPPITVKQIVSMENDTNPQDVLALALLDKTSNNPLSDFYFLPEQANVLSNTSQGGLISNLTPGPTFTVWWNDLQQNGEEPDKLSGILISKNPLIGSAKAVYLSEFPVASGLAAAVPSGGSASPSGSPATETATAPSQGTATATSETDSVAQRSTATEGTEAAVQPLLIAVLGAAFIGGLILNLMPCVLPVLSLKVFSLMKHAGEDPRGAWKQGAAFTAGVVISFWILAGLLLSLRAAGNQLGWGFQMQSPGFVLALIFIFFLLGLNLFGVFELGTSLVGLDAKVTGQSHGLTSSFLNGALATLAATPCTAPFMGSALGFAAQQPAGISLLIFTFLALGMAAPYLLLTIFPGALKFVPKPGAWMEAFKQFMGFLLMGTVIFLLYVFGALVGYEVLPVLLFTMLMAGVGVWNYGRWGRPDVSFPIRVFSIIGAVCAIGVALNFAFMLAVLKPVPASTGSNEVTFTGPWQPWSQDAVQQALAQGRPAFVDFTAAWCLSCKVNERVALDVDSVKKAFADKNVALFKADWTHADPEISKALQQYNRDGVPLYLLYSPKDPTKPQILPEVLTPGIVLDALGKI